jgi:hypothetical protein
MRCDPTRPRSLPALEAAVNVRRTRLELLVKVLDVEGVVERVEGRLPGDRPHLPPTTTSATGACSPPAARNTR